MRVHLQNLFKYALVGGCATVVDLAVFAVFAVQLHFNYLVVGGAGFLLGTAINYFLCVRYIYTSGQRFSARGEIIGVYVVGGVGLLLHEIILYVAHEHYTLPLMLCKVLAIGLVFFWNFGLRNFYLFASPGAPRPDQ
jgi:putative flippase GtrA